MIIALLLLAAASAQPAGATFTCTPTRVWDGDGPIWCAEGPRIRLAGVAAREIDGSCSRGHPCPSASGVEARDALVRLIGQRIGVHAQGHILVSGPALICRSEGSAGGVRTAAWCVSPRSGDLSCAMVRGGWAHRWDRYWRNHRC
jgi:endonuclease YncB( thermonuclease family)